MHGFQLSIALNNRAVSLLDSPYNYPAAIAQLKEALSTLKRSTQMQLHPTELNNFKASKITINDCMCNSMAFFNRHEHENHTPFLYRDAIFIPIALGTCLGHRERSMVSSIVIFNLALVHHLSTRWTTESDPSTNLHRALKLYELAFNMQREQLREVNVLFVLAVTNNIGMIQREIGGEESATSWFEAVLSTLMYMSDGQQPCSFPLDRFFINTRYLISKGSVAPAA
jgi:hypothetical protein